MTLERKLRSAGSIFLDHSGSGAGQGSGAGADTGAGAGQDADSRRHLLFFDPVEVLVAHGVEDVPDLLEAIDRHAAAGRMAAGYLAYEAAAAWIDPGGPDVSNPESVDSRPPLAWFGIYDRVEQPEPNAVNAMFNRLRAADRAGSRSMPPPVMTIADADYVAGVETVRDLIREGDVYQVNYTARFESDFTGDALSLYACLRFRQPVAYGAYVEGGDHQILSLSPELFFRRTGRSIETRPMKGTAPRGRTPEEDAALAAWLRSDPKSRAENLMIVDLLRNDLSIVCETGTVDVPALYRVESYPTLLQMISHVTGRLRPGTNTTDLFRALFPCGSVTGAPKRRAMRRIRELEPVARGVYCGAIGFVSADEAEFNVAIRTATVRDGRLRLGAGSGIVHDSDAREELAEARLKTAFFGGSESGSQAVPDAARTHTLAPAPSLAPDSSGFSLIETMLLDEGRIPLLSAHLHRLEASARFFGWMLDITRVESVVQHKIAGRAEGRHRVRMLTGPSGVESIAVHSLGSDDVVDSRECVVRIGVARTEVHSGNPFLRHKTTRRDVYDRARSEANERGLDEVILVNERGEITEGTITNVFLRLAGGWLTPPPSAGLLCGIARRVFSEAVGAVERPLTPDDVRTADEIVLTNAVRGARRVVLVD